MKMDLETVTTKAKAAKFFTSDSRKAGPGGVFVALKGEKNDGHAFAREALAKGCVGVVVNEAFAAAHADLKSNEHLWAVADTAKAHRALASDFRSRFHGKVIGVGGSSGKTSTKDFLAHLLGATYRVLKTQKSQNGELGIPKTLEDLDDSYDVAVIEIGIDAPGDMIRHVELVRPDIALLTSIGEEHLTQLKSIEGVFQEEKILFEQTWERGGMCFAPAADPYLSRLSHAQLQRTPALPEEVDASFHCGLQHPYLLQNAALALAVCRQLGMKPGRLMERLASLEVPEGRGGEHWKNPELCLISDYYNSNPSSVRAGLLNARLIADAKKLPLILILGDMLDLGSEALRLHEELLTEIKTSATEIFLVGPLFREAAAKQGWGKTAQFFENSALAGDYFARQKVSRGVVLVKGSRGMALEKVFQAL